jgi:hypothetical protein
VCERERERERERDGEVSVTVNKKDIYIPHLLILLK